MYAPASGYYVLPQKMGFKVDDVILLSEGNKINGWYFHQSRYEKPRGIILFFHGNGENRSTHFLSLLWILKEGFDFFIFDYRGYGESDAETTPRGTVMDGVSALQWTFAQAQKENLPVVLFAQSLGGAVALRSLIEYPVATHQSVPESLKLMVFDSSFESYIRAGASVLSKHALTFLFQPLSLTLSDDWAPNQAMKKLPKIPAMVFHGDQDQVIDQRLGKELYMDLPSKKTWVTVKGGHHIDAFVLHGQTYQKILGHRLNQLIPRGSSE